MMKKEMKETQEYIAKITKIVNYKLQNSEVELR